MYSKDLSVSGLEGRWNGKGRKVLYCADSIALAFLENMIRRQGVGFNTDFKIMIVEIPDHLEIKSILVADLDKGWRNFMNYTLCQSLGNQWYDEASIPVLKAPSAVLPEAYNYVINTLHPDFTHVRLVGTTELVPDPRIEQILKHYRP